MTVGGFFEIMVIIATTLGGIVVVISLGIYFVRVWRGYNNPNELIEEDSNQQNGQVNS